MAKLARMDSEPNINVLLAHDTSLRSAFSKIGSVDKLIRVEGTGNEMASFKNRSREDVKDTISKL